MTRHTAKTKLRVYYGLRGLTGKALAHHVNRDMRALYRHSGCVPWDGKSIDAACTWTHSPEGHQYWQDRHETL